MASSIPYLQFDAFPIKFDGPDLEIDPEKRNLVNQHLQLLTVTYLQTKHARKNHFVREASAETHPMVVIKLVVNESSEKRRRRQLFPTPAKNTTRYWSETCEAFTRRTRFPLQLSVRRFRRCGESSNWLVQRDQRDVKHQNPSNS